MFELVVAKPSGKIQFFFVIVEEVCLVEPTFSVCVVSLAADAAGEVEGWVFTEGNTGP
jgi:hypothetical protein